MLVEYVTSGLPGKSLFAPIKMCASTITKIPVLSDFAFRRLPLDLSNEWLLPLIGFEGGALNPGNDFMVVYLDEHKIPQSEGEEVAPAKAKRARLEIDPGIGWWLAARITLYILSMINGGMILAGMLVGVLAADFWTFTLFFLYGSHWMVSTLSTFLPMVSATTPPIEQDTTPRYAVYERPESGTVIFKGPKKTMEAWARTTWQYNPSKLRSTLHWAFMPTGALAAFSSLACMVNMRGIMQLGCLGVLAYATLAEIVATKSIETSWRISSAKPGRAAVPRLDC